MAKKRTNIRQRLKNPELIGKGKTETIQQILDRGAPTIAETIAKIKAKKESPKQTLHLTSTTSLISPTVAKQKVQDAIPMQIQSKLKQTALNRKPQQNVATMKKQPTPSTPSK